jgi:hypothetical protein
VIQTNDTGSKLLLNHSSLVDEKEEKKRVIGFGESSGELFV